MNSGTKATEAATSTVAKAGNAMKNAANAASQKLQNLIPKDPAAQQSALFWIIITGVLMFIFLYVIPVLIMQSKNSASTPNNIATTIAERRAIFETQFTTQFKDKKSLLQAIQEQDISPRENCLINFQPLTVIHPGYLGPVKDGVYDEQIGVSTVIRMGARCFVLPIDYHDKETMAKPFPAANIPCLLYRDEGETVRSINGGSIAKVAQTIADVAWSSIVSQRNDPFVLVLYFVRTPKEGTKEYLNFLSQVAVELAPLSQYLLTQTPEGVYNRQARQDQLMYVDTNQLEKKLIVMCNIDTSGFRTSKKDFQRSFLPKEDLDYWVHMRVFKQNQDSAMGLTQVPDKNMMARALVDTPSYYKSIPSDNRSQKAAVDGTKEKFVITLSPAGKNPENAMAQLVLNTFGVQAVPLFITESTPEIQTLLGNWKYAWKAKPKTIRYIRPEPITTLPQSPATNANGGSITVPA